MPSTFSLERSTTIHAPAGAIHDRINDFHQWVDWSPWEGLDPNLARTYSGPDAGPGASYAWVGTRKVGSGNMSITKSAADRIELDLNFLKPFKASNQTVFRLVPEGDATKVTWTMTGPQNLMSKVMGIFFPLEKFVGRDFEKGLASLKALVEKSA